MVITRKNIFVGIMLTALLVAITLIATMFALNQQSKTTLHAEVPNDVPLLSKDSFHSYFSANGEGVTIINTANNGDSSEGTSIGRDVWAKKNGNTITIFTTEGREIYLPEDSTELFYSFENVESIDLEHVNTRYVTNMRRMFSECNSLTTLDLSGFDTGNVDDIRGMFNGCSALQALDLRNWDVSSVSRMDGMFYGCSSLQSLDLSTWDTRGCENMAGMFNGCTSLEHLKFGDLFQTSNVTDFSSMFLGCSSLSQLDLSGFSFGSVSNPLKMAFFAASSDDYVALLLASQDASQVSTYLSAASAYPTQIQTMAVEETNKYQFIYAFLSNIGNSEKESANTAKLVCQNPVDFELVHVPSSINASYPVLLDKQFSYIDRSSGNEVQLQKANANFNVYVLVPQAQVSTSEPYVYVNSATPEVWPAPAPAPTPTPSTGVAINILSGVVASMLILTTVVVIKKKEQY